MVLPRKRSRGRATGTSHATSLRTSLHTRDPRTHLSKSINLYALELWGLRIKFALVCAVCAGCINRQFVHRIETSRRRPGIHQSVQFTVRIMSRGAGGESGPCCPYNHTSHRAQLLNRLGRCVHRPFPVANVRSARGARLEGQSLAVLRPSLVLLVRRGIKSRGPWALQKSVQPAGAASRTVAGFLP